MTTPGKLKNCLIAVGIESNGQPTELRSQFGSSIYDKSYLKSYSSWVKSFRICIITIKNYNFIIMPYNGI